jgi:hypothetical protein
MVFSRRLNEVNRNGRFVLSNRQSKRTNKRFLGGNTMARNFNYERTVEKVEPVKPKETRIHFTMEELQEKSVPELFELGRELKDKEGYDTLKQAIITVLGSLKVHNPTF